MPGLILGTTADFDWPGVAIAADVIARYGGRAWQMGACDYLSTVRSGVRLGGDPVDTPWDPGLREAMRAEGRAVYEETVGDQLLADLRLSTQAQANRGDLADRVRAPQAHLIQANVRTVAFRRVKP